MTNDHDHPIWPILRLLVLGAIISPVLWFNATSFDHTELQSILETLGAFGAVELLFRKLQHRSTK